MVAGGSMAQLFQAAIRRKRSDKTGSPKISIVTVVQRQKDLVFLKTLLESGKIRPVIDQCFSLSEISDAFWYFEKEHPRGKVVIRVI